MTALSTTFSPDCKSSNASSGRNCISPSSSENNISSVSSSFLQQQQQHTSLPLTDVSFFDNPGPLQSPDEGLGLEARTNPQQQQLGLQSPLLPTTHANISTQNLAKEWLEMFYNYNNYRYQQFPLTNTNQAPNFTNKVGSNVIPNYPVAGIGSGLIPPIGHWAMGIGAKTAPFGGSRLEGEPVNEATNADLGSLITPPRAEKYTIENLLDRVPETKNNRENLASIKSNASNKSDEMFVDHAMGQPDMGNDVAALNEQGGMYSKKGSTIAEESPFRTNTPMQQHSNLLGHPQAAAASLMLTHQAALMRHWQQQQTMQVNNTNKIPRNEQDKKSSNKGNLNALIKRRTTNVTKNDCTAIMIIIVPN